MAVSLITASSAIHVRPPASTFILWDVQMSREEQKATIVICEATRGGEPVLGGIRLSLQVKGADFLTALDLLNAPSDMTFTERIVALFIVRGILAPGSSVEVLDVNVNVK